MAAFRKNVADHIAVYGRTITSVDGKHETASIDSFSWASATARAWSPCRTPGIPLALGPSALMPFVVDAGGEADLQMLLDDLAGDGAHVFIADAV